MRERAYSSELSERAEVPYSIPLNKDQLWALSCFYRNAPGMIGIFEDQMDEFGWRIDKSRRIVRSLYGIVQVSEKWTGQISNAHLGYYLPEDPRILTSVGEAVATQGPIRLSFVAEDLPVLEALNDRNRELRRRYGEHFYPRFHETEVAKLTGLSTYKARQSLERLVGLLGRSTIQNTKYDIDWVPNSTIPIHHTSVPLYQPRWFVPTARVQQIEAVLTGGY